ncbi:MAG TPA: PEGA domain-containing protein [Methanoregulaceae archaeon]|nr:PEGA domain-containing protein [Methanoregulaceae archaeon]
MEGILRILAVAGVITVLCFSPLVAGEVSGADPGYFHVDSVPRGADIYFDGAYAGETPLAIPVGTTASGSHTIGVTAPGYDPWIQTYSYTPGPGQTVYVRATMVVSKQTGSVSVSSSPDAATATLDRSASQVTPCTFANVAMGSHEITISKPGFQTYYSSITVHGGKSTEVSAYLVPLQKTGNLAIHSEPGGASVYVDSIYYGSTPATVGNLVPGNHYVQLRLPGYEDWTGYSNVQAEATTTIDPVLVRNPPVSSTGTISVATNPPGASVYVDGIYRGETPQDGYLFLHDIAIGAHAIEIGRTGYQDYSGTVQVSAAGDTQLSTTLIPNPVATLGGLSITSSPSGAEVFVDNAYRGITPLVVNSLEPGSYDVHLKLGGYRDWQSTIQVSGGEIATVNAIFDQGAVPTPREAGSQFSALMGGILALAMYAVSRRI